MNKTRLFHQLYLKSIENYFYRRLILSEVSALRLRGRYSLFKIIFGGVIVVLANKSIMTRNFTLLSV